MNENFLLSPNLSWDDLDPVTTWGFLCCRGTLPPGDSPIGHVKGCHLGEFRVWPSFVQMQKTEWSVHFIYFEGLFLSNNVLRAFSEPGILVGTGNQVVSWVQSLPSIPLAPGWGEEWITQALTLKSGSGLVWEAQGARNA